ncbi:type II toxin-antitoxin system VapC family toxin [Candidatus Bipolaricaulota sp. J31]
MDEYVMDASVAVSLILRDEPSHEKARVFFRRFAKGEFQLMTTPLLIFEVTTALWKAARIGRIEIADALDALNAVEELRIPTSMPPSSRILKLAHGHGRTVYYAAYLALALKENAPLITADKRLFNALRGKFELIRWIEEVE